MVSKNIIIPIAVAFFIIGFIVATESSSYKATDFIKIKEKPVFKFNPITNRSMLSHYTMDKVCLGYPAPAEFLVGMEDNRAYCGKKISICNPKAVSIANALLTESVVKGVAKRTQLYISQKKSYECYKKIDNPYYKTETCYDIYDKPYECETYVDTELGTCYKDVWKPVSRNIDLNAIGCKDYLVFVEKDPKKTVEWAINLNADGINYYIDPFFNGTNSWNGSIALTVGNNFLVEDFDYLDINDFPIETESTVETLAIINATDENEIYRRALDYEVSAGTASYPNRIYNDTKSFSNLTEIIHFLVKEAGTWISFNFRVHPTEANYYHCIADVTNDELEIRKHTPSNIEINKTSFDFSLDTHYWMRITADGDQLSCEISADGNEYPTKVQATDSTYTTGKLGLSFSTEAYVFDLIAQEHIYPAINTTEQGKIFDYQNLTLSNVYADPESDIEGEKRGKLYKANGLNYTTPEALGYWSLQYDSSTQKNLAFATNYINLTVNGANCSQAGRKGCYFDGNDYMIHYGNETNLSGETQYAIAMWIKPTDAQLNTGGLDRIIMTQGTQVSLFFENASSQTRFWCDMFVGGGTRKQVIYNWYSLPNPTEEHFVVCNYNGTHHAMYIDDMDIPKGIVATTVGIYKGDRDSFSLGARYDGLAEQFNGTFRDVSLFKGKSLKNFERENLKNDIIQIPNYYFEPNDLVNMSLEMMDWSKDANDPIFTQDVLVKEDFSITEIYQTPVYETNSTVFILNVTPDNPKITSIDANLIYDGTDESYTTKDNYNFTKNKTLPLQDTNNSAKNFYWNYSVYFDYKTITNQTVTKSQNILYSYYVSDITRSKENLTEQEVLTVNSTIHKVFDNADITQVNFTFNNTENYTMDSVGNTSTENKYGYVITLPNIDSTNETVNLSTAFDVTYDGVTKTRFSSYTNSTIYQMLIIECGGDYDATTLILIHKNEYDLLNMTENVSTDVYFGLYRTGYFVRNYSYELRNDTAYYLCIYPSWATFQTNATIDYYNSNFPMRNYYLESATLTNVSSTINLYSLNSTYAKGVQILVKDVSQIGIKDVLIKIQRYYTGLNQYLVVAMAKTDFQGSSFTSLKLNDAWHKFLLLQGGTIQRTYDPMIIIDTADDPEVLTLNLEAEPRGEHFSYWGSIAHSCTFNNATGVMRCTIDDTTGKMVSSTLTVKEKRVLDFRTNCTTTANTSSATLLCNLEPYTNKTYFWTLETEIGGVTELLRSGWIGLQSENPYGLESVFMHGLLVMVLTLIGLWNPAVAIMFCLLGVVAGYSLNLSALTFSGVVGLIIAGGIIILRLKT